MGIYYIDGICNSIFRLFGPTTYTVGTFFCISMDCLTTLRTQCDLPAVAVAEGAPSICDGVKLRKGGCW